MARSSHNTVIGVTGTATSFTGAATTELAPLDGTVFQVTDATKRVLSPDHAVSVLEDGATLAGAAFSVDYLFGIVTLTTPAAGVITVTARYMPLLTVAEARSVEVQCSRSEFPLNYSGNSYVDMAVGRLSATVSIEGTRLAADSVDAAGTIAETWEDLANDGTLKLVEVNLGGRYFRCWGILPGLPQSSPEDGVISGAREFKSVVRYAAGRSEIVSFGFGA